VTLFKPCAAPDIDFPQETCWRQSSRQNRPQAIALQPPVIEVAWTSLDRLNMTVAEFEVTANFLNEDEGRRTVRLDCVGSGCFGSSGALLGFEGRIA